MDRHNDQYTRTVPHSLRGCCTHATTAFTRGTRHSTSERIVHNGVRFAHCATGSTHFAEGIMDDSESFPDKCIRRVNGINGIGTTVTSIVTSPSEEAEINSWTACAFFNLELLCVILTTGVEQLSHSANRPAPSRAKKGIDARLAAWQ
jgi:hypothetical protein